MKRCGLQAALVSVLLGEGVGWGGGRGWVGGAGEAIRRAAQLH